MNGNQNIFDDPDFFEGYLDLRSGRNFNDLLEQPAILSLLPDITGKNVLDIGCGYGINCLQFAQKAEKVVGIDISRRMLNVAMKENSDHNISYLQLAMEDLDRLTGPFDLIFSSLAFHYALDFGKLIEDCARLLAPGGILLFSQEHPMTTAAMNTDHRYVKDENGNCFFKVADYQSEGERHVRWFVDDVIHQHRKISTIVSTLCHNGFVITDCVEPKPDRKAIKQLPALARDLIKPSFIIFRARKGDNHADNT